MEVSKGGGTVNIPGLSRTNTQDARSLCTVTLGHVDVTPITRTTTTPTMGAWFVERGSWALAIDLSVAHKLLEQGLSQITHTYEASWTNTDMHDTVLMVTPERVRQT